MIFWNDYKIRKKLREKLGGCEIEMREANKKNE